MTNLQRERLYAEKLCLALFNYKRVVGDVISNDMHPEFDAERIKDIESTIENCAFGFAHSHAMIEEWQHTV